MKPFAYAVWLMPCAAQRDALRQTIDSLAARFGTPPFVPHVTLCSGVWNGPEAELIRRVDRLSAGLPIELSVEKIDWTDHWSTFFFLQLRCETDLFERAADSIKGSHGPDIGPHVSLLYGTDGTTIDRNALRAALDVPPVIAFDGLALVRPKTGRWQDVEAWKICYTFK
jgi:hypothetical protein